MKYNNPFHEFSQARKAFLSDAGHHLAYDVVCNIDDFLLSDGMPGCVNDQEFIDVYKFLIWAYERDYNIALLAEDINSLHLLDFILNQEGLAGHFFEDNVYAPEHLRGLNIGLLIGRDTPSPMPFHSLKNWTLRPSECSAPRVFICGLEKHWQETLAPHI